jgi:hypothetical protein
VTYLGSTFKLAEGFRAYEVHFTRLSRGYQVMVRETTTNYTWHGRNHHANLQAAKASVKQLDKHQAAERRELRQAQEAQTQEELA